MGMTFSNTPKWMIALVRLLWDVTGREDPGGGAVPYDFRLQELHLVMTRQQRLVRRAADFDPHQITAVTLPEEIHPEAVMRVWVSPRNRT